MILEKLIKSIKEGELTNPHLIATLLEGEQRAHHVGFRFGLCKWPCRCLKR
jgi:hypothetical protein